VIPKWSDCATIVAHGLARSPTELSIHFNLATAAVSGIKVPFALYWNSLELRVERLQAGKESNQHFTQ
jgi:hypothetical protein